MTLVDALIVPFSDYAFMRRALVGSIALSLGCAPLGVFLLLRRLSLIGDAVSHAILPGVAIGYLIFGLAGWAMALGGLISGLMVALFAGLAARHSELKEDASVAGFYLIALALGVALLSRSSGNIDLLNLLFGSVLAVDENALLLLAGVASFTLLLLAVFLRALVLESADPEFLRAVNGRGGLAHVAFLVLVVVNLVAGFQALGTLMSVGLMMLPAACSRLWSSRLDSMLGLAVLFALLSSVSGLLLSYHFDLPSGPAIILAAGAVYIVSLLIGRQGGVFRRIWQHHHLEA